MAPATPPPTWDPDHPSLTLTCVTCGLHVSFQCKSRLWFCCFKGMNVSLACILLLQRLLETRVPAGSLRVPSSGELSGLSIRSAQDRHFPGGPVPGLGISKARGTGSVPGQGTKSPKAWWLGKKKKFKCRVMYTFCFIKSVIAQLCGRL